MVDGEVVGGEREERAGGWEVGVVVIGVVIGDCCLGVIIGEGENGGGCDLGSEKVGDVGMQVEYIFGLGIQKGGVNYN